MAWLTDVKYQGRHRALTERDHHVSRGLALVSVAALSSMAHGGTAAADPPGGWDSIIACESGGRNVHTAIPGPFTASGFFQITNGTWSRHGGREFAPTAMQASFSEQKIVANRIFARNPSLSDWSSSRGCWASGKKRVTIQAPAAAPAKPKVGNTGNRIPPKATPKRPPAVGRAAPPPGPASAGSRTHLVRRGDTLSRLAGSHWRTIWQLNRATIGNNPNRIYPGQRLRLS
jgi:resuscitation-promoting factor RpfA